MDRLSLRLLSAASGIALVIAAAPGALAQGAQQNVTGGTQPQAGDEAGGGENRYGWPIDYVAQVGAGTTNGATTGYSGTDEAPSESPGPSLPDLPSPELCQQWEGTETFSFCMEKLVR